ncbi:MAG: helix-turn-helix transcriptional regulator [Leptospiraceae bacterium]|nr:helix-turn-helix transcriptional regulator [Leptospiraceae bacterium]
MTSENIGQRIKRIRIEKGFTQEGLEEGDDGISYRTIQNIESGKSSPTLNTLYRIAKKLNVTVTELLGEK